MFAFLLAVVMGASPGVNVEGYKTASGQWVFVSTEPLKYERDCTPYSRTGCWCAMCRSNGSSGYNCKTVCVNAPTPFNELEHCLRQARITADDVLYDLGCGDGRVCVLASKEFGCRSVGIDKREEAVELARASARLSGVDDLTRFYQRDAQRVSLSKADVVYAYLMPDLMSRISSKIRTSKVRLAISYRHRWVGGGRKLSNFWMWRFDRPAARGRSAVLDCSSGYCRTCR